MSLEDGTSYKEKTSSKEPLRQEVGVKQQRPKMSSKKVKGDGGRGSFEHRQ